MKTLMTLILVALTVGALTACDFEVESCYLVGVGAEEVIRVEASQPELAFVAAGHLTQSFDGAVMVECHDRRRTK